MNEALESESDQICSAAKDIVEQNEVTLFSKLKYTIPKIDYNHDYINNVTWKPGMHSSKYFQFDPAYGDIKRVWELNRFQYLNPVLTSYKIEKNESTRSQYREYIAESINSWMSQSPHLESVAWSCSQETSIRIFNMVQYYWHCDLEESRLDLKKFVNLLILSADKIYREIDFARAQRNNHSITESMALILLGNFFNTHPKSQSYITKGKKILLESLNDQFFEDGSYIQNSHTYHRFAIQSILIASQFIKGGPLLTKINEVVLSSYQFLKCHVANAKGEFPNYGPNDGALMYNYGWRDYRSLSPLLNAMARVLGLEESFGSNLDKIDDIMLDYSSSSSSNTKLDIQKTAFDDSGYYKLSNKNFSLFFRCGSYVNRLPSQADMLHVDLWYKGQNILIDSGTYEYFGNNGTESYIKYLSTAAHNTIDIDDLGQILKGPRFTWLSSVSSSLLEHTGTQICGEHYGFKGRVYPNTVHKRKIDFKENEIIIEDTISDVKDSKINLFWHIGDYTLRDIGDNAFEIGDLGITISIKSDLEVSAISKSKSLYYSHLFESPTIVAKATGVAKDFKSITVIKVKE